MKFTIKDRMTTAEPNAVLSYALDYRAEFEVDDEWADKVITARFVHSNGEYIDVVLDNFGCNIPLFPKGVLWVGAYTDSFTSAAVPIHINVTIKDLGEHEAIPPTADVYQQIIALIEAGRLKGDKGDPGEDYTITAADYQAIADRVPQPDLSEYVKNTDYATTTKGGVIKTGFAAEVNAGGTLRAVPYTKPIYDAANNYTFISKGTLENVLAERLKEPQFELIEEITLTEAVYKITRTAEPDGTPYNFKAVKVIATAPQNGYGWNCIFKNRINDTSYLADGSANEKWMVADAYIENGLLSIEFDYGDADINEYRTYSYKTAKYINSYLRTRAVYSDGISAVSIEGENQYSSLIAGTNIKIYAVRG